jgi:hypothetical protein
MKLRTLIFVVVVSLMVCPFAYAEMTVEYGGDVEIDWTFEQSSNGSDVFSVSPGSASLFGVTIRNETEDGLYAEGYGEGNWEVGGGVSAGDVYIQVGNPTMNLQIGNCGDDDMFVWGEDFYVASTGVDQYDGGYVPGTNMAYINFNASDALKVQFGARLGSGEQSYGDCCEEVSVGTNVYGVRPVITLTMDTITFGAGAEYYMESPQVDGADGEITNLGFGGYLTAEMGNITVGGGVAMGTTDGKSFEDDSDLVEETNLHARGFATFTFGEKYTFGVAGGMAQLDEADVDEVFGYVAYYIKPFMIEGLRLQTGAGFASGDDVTAAGGSIRLEYSF